MRMHKVRGDIDETDDTAVEMEVEIDGEGGQYALKARGLNVFSLRARVVVLDRW